MRWLKEGAWGDSIAIATVCTMFDVSINVLRTSEAGTSAYEMTPIACEQNEVGSTNSRIAFSIYPPRNILNQ